MTRHILITGANKGIGRATVAAVLDASDDTRVWLGARSVARGEDARAALIAEAPSREGRVEVLEIDVSDEASVRAAAARVREPLYGIVNNAGIGAGSGGAAVVLDVNTRGPHRVCEAFLPLLQEDGRIVNVSSASGPTFVAGCSPERRAQLTDPGVTWEDVERLMDAYLAVAAGDGDFAAADFGSGDAYGMSKACLNAYTVALARRLPGRLVNACTPGFIETDLTRPLAERRGEAPASLGMKPPSEGTRATLHLLLGDPGGSGWYFGSDAQRSPLDRYRSPGDPPFRGQ